MKIGFIAILGRPNAGKSTLLNCLLSKKVSIVSPRAQTTRDAIMGIYNEKNKQIVFVDTPGIYYGDGKLDSHMRRAAFSSSREVDGILYLLDASASSLEKDIKIIRSIDSSAPRIFVLNKIDLIRFERGEELTKELKEAFPDAKILLASLKENYGIKEIKEAIDPLLSEGEALYPSEVTTDKDKQYVVKEVIREELLHFLKQEVPHQSAVKINTLEHVQGGYKIEATVIVEKEAHKGIVIGKGGEMIKRISMSARHELERMWHEHITSLTLEVEACPGWRNSPKMLKELGYGDL